MIYYYEHTGAISEVLENSLKCTILIKGSWMKKNTKKYIQFLSFPIDIRIHLVADVLITSVCKLLSWCIVWKKAYRHVYMTLFYLVDVHVIVFLAS